MKNINLFCMAIVLLAFAGSPVPAAADGHWTDEWEIKVDGKSESHGAISFEISFEPGDDDATREPIILDVLVAYDTGENEIAFLISNHFRAVLGDQEFEIEVESGEQVEMEARKGTPDFALAVTASEVRGIRIKLDN